MTLADRVKALEKQVALLTSRLVLLEKPKDWRSTIGMFSGDEVMKEICAEAHKIREKDRAKAKRAIKRSRRVAS